jgi:hypothetical protein
MILFFSSIADSWSAPPYYLPQGLVFEDAEAQENDLVAPCVFVLMIMIMMNASCFHILVRVHSPVYLFGR